MVDKSSTAPSGQFKGLSAGGRRIFHHGPRPFKGFPRAVDESSAANPTNLNSMFHEQAKGKQSKSVFFVLKQLTFIPFLISLIWTLLNISKDDI